MDQFYELTQILNGKKRRELYLKYLLQKGLFSSSRRLVGEIGGNVDMSLTRYIHSNDFESVLISTSVDYEQLKKYGIKGLNGYINNGELYYQEPNSDIYQFDKRRSLQFFDAIYSIGFNKEVKDAIYSIEKMPKFIGQCVILDDRNIVEFYDELYPEECRKLNAMFDDEYYSFTKETNKKDGVSYYLIKNKF